MCEYLTQIIRLGNTERISGDKFRARLAAIVDNDPAIPSALFNYDKKTGRPRNHLPGIRFGGGRGVGRIEAVGDEAVDLLAAVGHRVTRALGHDCGKVLPDQRYSGQVTSQQDGRVYEYIIPTLYAAKSSGGGRSKKAEEWRSWLVDHADDHAAVSERLVGQIRQGLGVQADTFGIDLPEDYLLGSLTFDRILPLPFAQAGTFGIGVKRIHFQSDLKLVGPWHVGYLQARGYGSIRAYRQ